MCVRVCGHVHTHYIDIHEWMSDISHLECGRLVGVAWGADPLEGVFE